MILRTLESHDPITGATKKMYLPVWYRDDVVFISCNPGGFAFLTQDEWQTWNKYCDAQYPIIGVVVDVRDTSVAIQVGSRVHFFNKTYAESRRCIFDHVCT